MTADEIRAGLADLAERRRTTVADYDAARARLRDHRQKLRVLAEEGRAAGLTTVEIARLAGVTRQTVYDLLPPSTERDQPARTKTAKTPSGPEAGPLRRRCRATLAQ